MALDMNGVIAAVGKMFPSANLNGAIQKAQQAIAGTPDSLDGVRETANRLGLNSQFVNDIYRRYGNTVQGRTICGILGTTPEALKSDADRIVGGNQNEFSASKPAQNSMSNSTTSTRFPRLK